MPVFVRKTTFKSASATLIASKGTFCRFLASLPKRNAAHTATQLKRLQQVAVANGNLFAELMEAVKFYSLGQITNALFEAGGE